MMPTTRAIGTTTGRAIAATAAPSASEGMGIVAGFHLWASPRRRHWYVCVRRGPFVNLTITVARQLVS